MSWRNQLPRLPTSVRKHPLGILLVVTAAVRLTLLFVSQNHVHSDEAIIGLMGKHILEGRYFPFYMYGQAYNAGAAWEAYLASIPFAVFGVGVIPLKAALVALSILCLILFYRMAAIVYDRRVALLASLIFVSCPSLMKWSFQVRGYSWYFLSIPILTGLYFILSRGPKREAQTAFVFGLASGVAIWNLELVLPLVAALWLLLAVRRRLSAPQAAMGCSGFLVGYAPAIVFNLTHGLHNWKYLLESKTSLASAFAPGTLTDIFLVEIPKFFGPDTLLWYYPETPASGYVFYAIAVMAAGAAAVPLLVRRSAIGEAWRCAPGAEARHSDLIVLVLTLACFVPYLAARFRMASYFLSGCFFLSLLAGRLVARCLDGASRAARVAGVVVLGAALITGCLVTIELGRRSEIETITLDGDGGLTIARFPGADIDAVERCLREYRVRSVWTTLSFVYPLIFESGETVAASSRVFGVEYQFYPDSVARPEPSAEGPQVFVIETDSPYRPEVMARCSQKSGVVARVIPCGKLSVIAEAAGP